MRIIRNFDFKPPAAANGAPPAPGRRNELSIFRHHGAAVRPNAAGISGTNTMPRRQAMMRAFVRSLAWMMGMPPRERVAVIRFGDRALR